MTRRRRFRRLQLGLAAALGAGAALLVACGGSPALIPPVNAGALTVDFAAVAAAVSNGSCKQTVSAIVQTRGDLAALPATLDPHLARALRDGVQTLSKRAQIECRQKTTSTTPTNTSTTPTNTDTTPTDTNTNATPTNTDTTPSDTNTNATPTDTTTGIVPDNGGGTPAPNAQPGQGKHGAGGTGNAGAGGALGGGGEN